VEKIPRLRGDGKHHIQYHHIIDWLVRKPGAFENYRYREDLFPSIHFRMVYDGLKTQHTVQKAARVYLKILEVAATEGESLVEQALENLLDLDGPVSFLEVQMIVENWKSVPQPKAQLRIEQVDLRSYDGLLVEKEAM
jgi:hypothetical protein